jgi:hypothetical protein
VSRRAPYPRQRSRLRSTLLKPSVSDSLCRLGKEKVGRVSLATVRRIQG